MGASNQAHCLHLSWEAGLLLWGLGRAGKGAASSEALGPGVDLEGVGRRETQDFDKCHLQATWVHFLPQRGSMFVQHRHQNS